ncbi:excisionase family DNA-binding protein [Longimicrobium sp.]|uniref:excisionase family DNA-binding protein n=1 Tax=Longimicrobium sp. TaxID=2029185 RepID=UPI002E3394F2|nr:excisionase family DNA-binding protein [Longimicrobium sp.]
MVRPGSGTRTLVDALAPPAEEEDREAALRTAQRLRHMQEDVELIIRTPSGEVEALPRDVARLVASLLEEVAQGNTVALVTEAEEVTTSVAAEFLGVSRPHVVKLIEAGFLPCRMAGSHRRVRLTDLVGYKRVVDRRHTFLDALMAETEELGLYDSPPSRSGR